MFLYEYVEVENYLYVTIRFYKKVEFTDGFSTSFEIDKSSDKAHLKLYKSDLESHRGLFIRKTLIPIEFESLFPFDRLPNQTWFRER